MTTKVVSNTGPFIHLNEIGLIEILKIFKELYVPNEVKAELIKYKIEDIDIIKVINLNTKFKEVSEIFVNKFFLNLGESQAIALALQERVNYFLTDDLDARVVAKMHNIEVHGTIGLILRAFKDKKIDKETAINKVRELYTKSSLFITKDLIYYVVKSIEEF